MSGEKKEKRQVESAVSHEANVMFLNEMVVDQLQLLNYDVDFCNAEFPPVGSTFFTYPVGAIQVKYFQKLVSWLVRKCGKDPTWSEWDDPNTMFTNLLVLVNELNGRDLEGTSLGELKKSQGVGESICRILLFLSSRALQQARFVFAMPEYPEDYGQDQAALHQAEEDEDDVQGDLSNVDIELLVQQHMLETAGIRTSAAPVQEEDRKAISSSVAPYEWQLEVERVAGKLLPAPLETGAMLVRAHMEQTKLHKQHITEEVSTVSAKLQTLQQEVARKLKTIADKEKSLNQQFAGSIGDHASVKVELRKLGAAIEQRKAEVSRTEELAASEGQRCAEIKAELEERTSALADNSDLINKQQAVKALREQVAQMSLKTGVVAHQLLHAKMRERSSQRMGTHRARREDLDDIESDTQFDSDLDSDLD